MRRLGTLALVGLLVMLTACTGSSSQVADVRRKAQTEACPPFTQSADGNRTFTWMYSADNSSFDPDHITTNNSQMYLYPIYDSLVHINEKGKPEPMLAKSWTVSEDGDTLVMNLIDNWQYHDGAPFNAESVVQNIERHKQPSSFNATALAIVEDVEAVDSDTVRFETNGAAGALVGVLGGAAGMMMSPRVMDDKGQDLKPTGGSGAFTMEKYVSGSRVVYEAVDNYWDPNAQNVDRMVFLISEDDNARLNAVTTGAADATFLRSSMYEAAKQDGLVVCEQPSLSQYTMNLNTSRSEFDKKEVRLAINQAIDREAIAALTDGFCEPGAQMFPPWYFAANPAIGPSHYEYDPGKAKQLLKQAGLAKGFSFDLEVVNLSPYQEIAEVVQANLAQVGIKMSITPVELDALGEHFSVNKNVDAILFEQKSDADPSIVTSQYYVENGYNNPGGWGTEEITRLNHAAMAGATPSERDEPYDRLFKAVTDEVAPNVTLCHLTTPFAMNRQVQGVEIYADASRQFRGVGMEPSN